MRCPYTYRSYTIQGVLTEDMRTLRVPESTGKLKKYEVEKSSRFCFILQDLAKRNRLACLTDLYTCTRCPQNPTS